MGKYLLRRLLQGIPTFFGVTLISFLLMQAAPGDPIELITFRPDPKPETAAAMRRQLGLDQPPLVQYAYWLIGNDWMLIDIDGDTRSDMQLARELIELNGGVVDAYVTDDDSFEGKISANTRYLVLGDLPESATRAKLRDTWNAMYGEATSLGVETISLSEFLNQMGYKPQDRSVQLGSRASARDFPARAGDAQSRPAPRFRPRTPYRAPAATTATPE